MRSMQLASQVSETGFPKAKSSELPMLLELPAKFDERLITTFSWILSWQNIAPKAFLTFLHTPTLINLTFSDCIIKKYCFSKRCCSVISRYQLTLLHFSSQFWSNAFINGPWVFNNQTPSNGINAIILLFFWAAMTLQIRYEEQKRIL